MNVSQTPDSASTLHLLGRFSEPFTGAERELIDLRHMLCERRPVQIWSEGPLHAVYLNEDIHTVQPFSQRFPKDGTLLIGGVHIRPPVWLKYTRFERIILFHNLSNQAQLFAIVESVREFTDLNPELVFVSHLLQMSAGLPGRVIRSLLDLKPFLAVAAQRLSGGNSRARPFTVGRASRDALEKHDPRDISLYKMLASRGIAVRIMGGACLAPGLAGVPGVQLLPAGAEQVADFYRSLDAVFYRTGSTTEAYGRVVVEAMGAGLPVVAHARGGYTEVMEHGVSGFLIHSQEQAYDALLALRDSPALCRNVGEAAMRKAIEIHGTEATQRELAFYLRS